MNKTTEKWYDIPGYEGIYQISNLKRVKSLKRTVKFYNKKNGSVTRVYPEKIMKVNEKNNRLELSKEGKSRSYNIDILYQKIWVDRIKLPKETDQLRKVNKYNKYGYLQKTYKSLSHAAYHENLSRIQIKNRCNGSNKCFQWEK